MSSTNLPSSVTNLLKSTRFVHLATCYDNIPHVSLMNYTYYSKNNEHFIIISTPTKTKKYENILNNPNVSLLVHDWISAKTTETEDTSRRRNSLFELLTNINKSEISSVSVMLNGKAEILDKGADIERFNFFKSLHCNNSLIDLVQAKNYIEDDDNVLIVVNIESCKVTDTENNIIEY